LYLSCYSRFCGNFSSIT